MNALGNCQACGEMRPCSCEVEPEFYYRETNARWFEDVLAISVIIYRIVSRTPKGCWIAPDWDDEARFKKFILEGKGKRYAYPTREEARASFIIRKKKEIQHCAAQRDRAVRYLALAETMEFGSRTEALHEAPLNLSKLI